MKYFILIIAIGLFSNTLHAQKCKAEDKYGYIAELYNNKGEVEPGYFIVNPGFAEQGICDSTGKMIVPIEYNNYNYVYCNGKIIVQNLEKKIVHLWDLKAKTKLKLPAIKSSDAIGDNGLIAIQTATKKWGYCDLKGKVVIPAKFDYAEEFRNGKAITELKEKYGIINEKGAWVLQPKDNIYYYYVSPTLYYFRTDKNDTSYYGLMDHTGKILINADLYTDIEERNGFLELKIDKTRGALFNYNGKKLTGDNCRIFDGDFKRKANGGLIVAKDINGYMFAIDTAGQKYLENKYFYIYQHKNFVTQKPTGNYTVCDKPSIDNIPDNYTIIKTDGTTLLKGTINDIINYDDTYFFTGVGKDDMYTFSLIKADGTVLAKDVCNKVIEFYRHFAFINKGDKYGAINMLNGEIVIPIEYEKISSINECSIMLQNKNDKYEQFNSELKIIK